MYLQSEQISSQDQNGSRLNVAVAPRSPKAYGRQMSAASSQAYSHRLMRTEQQLNERNNELRSLMIIIVWLLFFIRRLQTFLLSYFWSRRESGMYYRHVRLFIDVLISNFIAIVCWNMFVFFMLYFTFSCYFVIDFSKLRAQLKNTRVTECEHQMQVLYAEVNIE